MATFNTPFGHRDRWKAIRSDDYDPPMDLDTEALELVQRARQGLSQALDEES